MLTFFVCKNPTLPFSSFETNNDNLCNTVEKVIIHGLNIKLKIDNLGIFSYIDNAYSIIYIISLLHAYDFLMVNII